MSETNTPRGDASNRLGTEPVGKLLLKFSIPAIVGMLVSALYNMVDRIFVGRGVSEAALGGLALTFPLMTIGLAFAMLFGFGAANMISMRLGQGRKEEAQNALTHCFFLLIAIGIVTTILGLIFIDPIIAALGSHENSLAISYARDYFQILLYGQTFFMLSFGLSHCTRAQGFPMISMIGMFIGAILNIILDYLFIFVFPWGIKGAAWATVISQFTSTIWFIAFGFNKKAVVRLTIKAFKASKDIIVQIMAFGSAQFLLQLIMALVQFLYNASMNRYGAESLGVPNGGDIALSGMNIVVSINMLIMMPVFGINQGVQPLLGYNYGAKKYGRVINAYIRASIAATCVCTAGFIAVQLFPHALTAIFAPDGSPELLRFTPHAMRVIMLLMPLIGFQIISANVFVATGRPRVSIFLSVLRQLIILIPCILIFGRLWGLEGIIWAAPVADAFSFLLTGVMIFIELRKLRHKALEEGYRDWLYD